MHFIKEKNQTIAGVDEVGRGPLAGPVVVGVVTFPNTHKMHPGIKDSKKLSKKMIAVLNSFIYKHANVEIGVGSVELINKKGIACATTFAIEQALKNLKTFSKVIIDGKPFKNNLAITQQTEFITKGDDKIYQIAAASIVAKYYRDKVMLELAQKYPQYGWESNVGYGTKKHREAIKKYGLTEHHRELFCRKIV